MIQFLGNVLESQGPWVALVCGLLYVMVFHMIPDKVWKAECAQRDKLTDTLDEMSKSMAVLLDRRG